MKFIEILIFFLACFTFVNTIKRTKLKEDFKCNIRIDGGDSGNKEYEVNAKKSDVMDSKNAKPLGLYFYNLSGVEGDLASALVKDGSAYYIPYRIVTSEWKAIQTGTFSFSYNFLQTTILIGKRFHTFKMKFERNSWDEMENYALMLTNKSTIARRKVTENLQQLKIGANNYEVEMKNVDASSKGIDGLKNQLKENETKKQTLESELKNKEGEFNKIQEEIRLALQKLSDLRLNEENITSQMKQSSDLIESLNRSITELNDKIKNNSTGSENNKKLADQHLSTWGTNADNLKKIAPEYSVPKILDDTLTNLKQRKSSVVLENLNKINN